MVVTDLSISLPVVLVDYGCILEFLWDSVLPPHAVKELCKFLCHWLTSCFIDLASEPGALPDNRCCTAFVVSVRVGNSSSSTLHSICGNLLMPVCLIVNGRLSSR